MASLLRDRCRTEGLSLVTEPALERAAETIRQLEPSVIIVDTHSCAPDPAMPETCPVGIVARALPEQHIPIVALTAPNRTTDKLRAFEAGAFDALSRPFDLSELMARLGNAIERSQLIEMLNRESNLDAMTGLWNRAKFDQVIGSLTEDNERSPGPACLMLADLDRFKTINDTYGHRFGDHVIRVFANVLTKVLRSDDLAFRYGGEEFAVILKDTIEHDASQIADRIRRTLKRCEWTAPSHTASPETITCSIGLALLTASTPTAASWFDAADAALYDAKDNGRDKAHRFTPPSGSVPVGGSLFVPRRLAG